MLTEKQIETLKEMMDIGVGRAGSILGELVGSTVKLHVPTVGLCKLGDLDSCLSLAEEAELAAVRQQFSGSLKGLGVLLFPRASGNDLARKLIADDPSITCIDSERMETLTELGNILLNSVLGSLSNLLEQRLEFELPVYAEGTLRSLVPTESDTPGSYDPEAQVLYANAHFDIEAFRVTGNVLIIVEADSFGQLLSKIDQLALESTPS